MRVRDFESGCGASSCCADGAKATVGEAEKPDRLEEACAVFGVYAPGEDVARLTCFGL